MGVEGRGSGSSRKRMSSVLAPVHQLPASSFMKEVESVPFFCDCVCIQAFLKHEICLELGSYNHTEESLVREE